MSVRNAPLLATALLLVLAGCDSDSESTARQIASPTASALAAVTNTGLRVTLTSEPNGPMGHVKLLLDVRDDDAGSTQVLYAVDFGDGTGFHSGGKPVASCRSDVTPPPPRPLTKTLTLPHIYPRAGTYLVTAIVETFSLCVGPRDETRTATTRVVVGT
jgi:hypothetical protein